MQFKVSLTTEQLAALHEWTSFDLHLADVLIDQGEDGESIRVGQGDSRAVITPDGEVTDAEQGHVAR